MPTAVVPVMPISESKSRPTLLLMNGLAERSGISTWPLMTPPASLTGVGLTRRKRFMPIIMYSNRFWLPMASLLKSSPIIVPFSITKEKTPHHLMRIHRHSLDTPVSSSASGWIPVACLRLRAYRALESDAAVTPASRVKTGRHSWHRQRQWILKVLPERIQREVRLLPNSTKSVFVEQPSDEQINLTLAVLTGRTIDRGHSIKFKSHYYRLLNSQGEQVHYAAGTKVLVIQAFDGSLYCSVNDTDVYALEAIPDRAAYSPKFDPEPAPQKPKKPNIPDMNHPWKKASYMRYLRSRSYPNNETLKELL